MQALRLLGIFILKIISWSDNPTLRKKDAEDMIEIASNYFFAGNEERIYQEHPDICDIDDHIPNGNKNSRSGYENLEEIFQRVALHD